MRATDWEFKNRGTVFGLIFGVSFLCYSFDHQTSGAVLADLFAARSSIDAKALAQIVFGVAAVILALAALVRTWASSYLRADVVYASKVKSAWLVADGPYSHVRNPLYFANLLMAFGFGLLMSPNGFALVLALMLIFNYRLILREESELRASQGARFESYCKAVPRLLFSPSARITSSGRAGNWSAGFKAEFWCWGLTVGAAAFAITLKPLFLFGFLGAAIALFWLTSHLLQRHRTQQS